jgi:hypothetical protein
MCTGLLSLGLGLLQDEALACSLEAEEDAEDGESEDRSRRRLIRGGDGGCRGTAASIGGGVDVDIDRDDAATDAAADDELAGDSNFPSSPVSGVLVLSIYLQAHHHQVPCE